MFDKKLIEIFLQKVPDLRNPWKTIMTVGYLLILGVACGLFFYYIDRLAPYAAILSQLVMALVVWFIGYMHFKKAVEYREKYGGMAYRYLFYRWMIPYLVTWYACFFHPLFVDGTTLLPPWLAMPMGVLLLVVTVLANIHIERAGFFNVTHGMDIYTVFPEEATIVHGKIYGYIRHPLYFSLMCGSIGLALFRNNAVALVVALLQLIPALAIGYMEDKELIAREGDVHRKYIQDTSALIPINRFGGFLRLLVFLDE
jgi:protein-S-isoprenylcysteine O-methyltransferase Ste14